MQQDADVGDLWVGELARLWDAIGKPLDADRLAIYQRELADIPLGLLERTMSRVIRENTYSNVPPVGVIWKALRAELGDPRDVMDAMEQWCEHEFSKCVMRFGVLDNMLVVNMGHELSIPSEVL